MNEPKLKDEEIKLLLMTLDSRIFPEEFNRHPKNRSRSVQLRTERKLKAILKYRGDIK